MSLINTKVQTHDILCVMISTQSKLHVAIVAFDRPLTLKHLLRTLRNTRIESVSFFFDHPKDSCINLKKYEETLNVAQEWSGKCKFETNFYLSQQHLGGNRNTLRALDFLTEKYGNGLLLEDDSDIHPEYLNLLIEGQELLINSTKTKSLYGISPFLASSYRNLENLPGDTIRLFENRCMGGSLGLFVTFEMLSDFYTTCSLLGQKSEFAKLIDAVVELPLPFAKKISYLNGIAGKYLRYIDFWSQGIPSSETHIPSWDSLMICSVLIRGKKVLTPDFSLVREYPQARIEGSWHASNPQYDDWREVPDKLSICVDDSTSLYGKLVADQVNSSSRQLTILQKVQAVFLLYLPRSAKLSFALFIRKLSNFRLRKIKLAMLYQ